MGKKSKLRDELETILYKGVEIGGLCEREIVDITKKIIKLGGSVDIAHFHKKHFSKSELRENRANER